MWKKYHKNGKTMWKLLNGTMKSKINLAKMFAVFFSIFLLLNLSLGNNKYQQNNKSRHTDKNNNNLSNDFSFFFFFYFGLYSFCSRIYSISRIFHWTHVLRFILCNYDKRKKHKVIVLERCLLCVACFNYFFAAAVSLLDKQHSKTMKN